MSQRARLYAASRCGTSSAMSPGVPGCSHAGCSLYADCKSLFLAWDNANGPLSDRSMHSHSSVLQLFFTSELLDMETFNGIDHVPSEGWYNISAAPQSASGGNLESRHAGILVVRALGA